ncbi:MAG: DUF2189 domain-containing protein [Limimaricola soesokkakensis]|uniref:Putative membrane protein n=1 Tax=Limimaricola soesokkakensis TaxID=1343159 RepID=A0A1X6Z6J8_9RHOB|nr:DUF2189 domain-containing protein [Limimaricola soesokkakensis]PSK86697.1 putative membrane protein [Limimaricola soesokkakensis]SLN42386.1 hypothetical protein LOS8367_01824 [Limimaricola soesokkakensis]
MAKTDGHVDKTIGNPLSWAGHVLNAGTHHLGEGARETIGRDTAPIKLRRIETEDLKAALRAGYEDFKAFRSDVIFLCVVYPLAGLVLIRFAMNENLLPLLVPLITGFALLGPVAAVGLYEMSRRREAGGHPTWGAAFKVIESPSAIAILTLGVLFVAIFAAWMLLAWSVYALTLGPEPPVSAMAFINDTLTTGAGWAMIVVGTGIGFVLAATVLVIGVISFPLLLDRHVGVRRAVKASARLAAENPRTVALWGAIVVVGLGAGMATLMVGLVFVLPILGHATWHLYRRAVEPA